ncbi:MULTISPECIES: TetR/AcrR family transcriptional regulator [Pseudovibrio]|nr:MULTISPECIES: TetR/AcrR family transcriptional regulator [Pseudovibrio]EEA94805.1 regulatory protein, TetR [Pseudovibrio sp. JE062]
MKMKKSEATRQHILETGRKLIAEQGFSSMGLSVLLKTAGVPKGSFYHYFESKEHFGCVLVQQYLDEYMKSLDALFETDALNMREKLFQYWHLWENYQHSEDASKHCLIVKLSAEIADISEDMRELLARMTAQVERRLGDVIEAGVQEGSIAPKLNARMTAQMLYQMWLGASLIGKVTREKTPLQKALEVTEIMLPAA